MDLTLLATKLRIPPQPHQLVQRRRLTDALERGIPRFKLTLIAAPAGYGKTTALAQWANASQLAIAWLSLSAEDNDLERFLRYLLAAWETVQPDILDSPLGLLLSGQVVDSEVVLTTFINTATRLEDDLVFILDDYHTIETPAIHAAMSFLLHHLPPRMHFALACQANPPLPLAQLRARRALFELHADDLRFLSNETADFLTGLHIALTPEQITALQTQLEGWIAGLHLVAPTLDKDNVGRTDLSLGGRQRHIADYLRAAVLERLEPEMRRFALQTSLLERLCGPLCAAVTERPDAQEVLEQLEYQGLFLVPLDDRREWYRYHRLFADFLREELRRHQAGEIGELHQRAAAWYLEHDAPEQAFEHGLAGEDVELVIQTIDRYASAKLLGGEIRVVQDWLAAIPATWLATYPAFGLFQATLLLATGQFETCARQLSSVEQRSLVQDDSARWSLARVTALRCYIACYQNDLAQAENLAEQALRGLPEDDMGFRPGIYGALGDTYRRNGHWDQAKTCYLTLLDYAHTPAFRVQAVHVFGSLADLCLRQGHLRDAAGFWQQALDAIQDRANWGSYPLPLIGWVYIRLGELHYEWNALAETQTYLSQGLERAQLGGDVRALIAGNVILARLSLAQGDLDAAADYLQQARPLMESAQFTYWNRRFERVQLELWLAQDRLRTAADWAIARSQATNAGDLPESDLAQLALARVLIVKGDTPATDQALALIADLQQSAEAEGRWGVVIEAQALETLAHWQRGERVRALTALEKALRLAEPEGYIRLFADLGLPMLRVLQEAHARSVLPAYVDTLLAAFATDSDLAGPVPTALPEPLTAREQDVLELMAAGLTNREIADSLVVSPETVKKHASSIYGKLGVSNRTEATARARELRLLD
jgi:LuxR family maltose regulon positive regulatory protein